MLTTRCEVENYCQLSRACQLPGEERGRGEKNGREMRKREFLILTNFLDFIGGSTVLLIFFYKKTKKKFKLCSSFIFLFFIFYFLFFIFFFLFSFPSTFMFSFVYFSFHGILAFLIEKPNWKFYQYFRGFKGPFRIPWSLSYSHRIL